MSDTVERITKEVNAAFSTAEGGHSKIQVSAHDLRAMLSSLREQERTIISLESRVANIETAVTEFEESLAFTPVSELPDESDLFECFCGKDAENGGHIFLYFDADTREFYSESEDSELLIIQEDVLFWRPMLPAPGHILDILPKEE